MSTSRDSAAVDNKTLIPSDLLYTVWNYANYLAGYEQHDAHEFLMAFFNGLEAHLEQFHGSKPVSTDTSDVEARHQNRADTTSIIAGAQLYHSPRVSPRVSPRNSGEKALRQSRQGMLQNIAKEPVSTFREVSLTSSCRNLIKLKEILPMIRFSQVALTPSWCVCTVAIPAVSVKTS